MTQTGKQERPTTGTRCLGVFLAALVLFLAATAVSPSSHRAIHHDSGHLEHQCAITMFAHGVEPAQCAVEVSWSAVSSDNGASVAPAFAKVSEPAHLRPPASGPPVA